MARIQSRRGETVGAGFLIGDDAVVTCAHVLRAGGYGPGDRVRIVFPHAQGAPWVEGDVPAESWRDPEAEDVAVVRLRETPGAAQVLELGSAAGCRGHAVRSFGFPGQAPPGGHFGYAVAGDLLPDDGTDGLLQLTGANDLTRGFSGGPVVDDVTGLVIGMVTAITAADEHLRGQGIAYATPTQALRRIRPGAVEHAVSPYRGLEPFTSEQAAWFHGRDIAVDTVLTALAGQRRALLLLGPSGSGKSSLVQAGVLPALAGGRLPGSDRWRPVVVRPGEHLPTALERHGLPGAAADGITAAARQRVNGDTLCDRLVLVIDQFEEILSGPAAVPSPLPPAQTAPSGGEASVTATEQITELIRSPVPAVVIIIMRDDFYPRMAAEAPQLLEAASPGLVNVPATLSQQDLHAIITHPARAAGLRLESGLTERIIADVLAADLRGTPARAAPVTALVPLQLTLRQLWERRDDGCLTHTAYEHIGQINGTLTTWCNTALDRLPTAQRTTARRLLTALVRPADPVRRIPAIRQQVPLDVLRDLASGSSRTSPRPPASEPADQTTDAVLAALTRHRIITTHARDPGPPPVGVVAELAHDTLTQDWGELRDWVAEDQQFHTWLHRAEEQRARWARRHDPEDLLHGTALADGLDWSHQRGLPGPVADFLEASHHNQKAALRRTKRINLILIGALVLALIATGLALWQRQTAVAAQQIALSRQLAAQSQGLTDTDPDLASLLAVQAYRTHPTAAAALALYSAASLPLRHRLTGHHDGVTSVAYSPDGRTLATGSEDGSAKLWNAATGHLRTTLTGHHDGVTSVAYDPDGRTLATGSEDGSAKLWNAATGHLRTTLTGHHDGVTSVAYSPDGRTLATGSEDGSAKLWNAATGHLRTTLTGHHDGVTSVAYSPDGRTLATGSEDGSAKLWNAATGHLRTTLTGHHDGVTSVAYSPDGRTLATGSEDGSAKLWNTATGHLRTTPASHSNGVTSVVFSPDGHTLATGDKDHWVRLWALSTATGDTTLTGVLRNTVTGHSDGVSSVVFSPDGHTLATASEDRTARLSDIAVGHTRTTLTGHTGSVMSVAFSPDGRTVATGGWDGTARLWDTATGRLRTVLTDHVKYVLSVAFSPDGHTLATANDDGTAKLWDIGTGRLRTTLTGHSDGLWSVAFSPDGHTLATGGIDRTAKLWDTGTGRLRTTLTGHSDGLWSVAFSPDGHTLATASEDRTAKLWDTGTGRLRTTLTGHSDGVTSVAFSPDGHTLATGGIDRTAKLWDTGTGRLRTTLTGHSDGVTSVAFSPDGHTLATASNDGTAKLWDVAAGGTRTTLTGHVGYVTSVAFSPGGHGLATGGIDRRARLWEVALPGQTDAIRRICRAVHRNFTAQERATYLSGRPEYTCAP
ncbi:hypothetical protein HUT19_33185 [Streptomyces sp. NA02950]|nr:hypothetical protein HUT19_19200 [Streptomyces sp. NA02950]QKV97973.1 hypothetical protein HUT19_33185 [Streptomyces sp. NA02950]